MQQGDRQPIGCEFKTLSIRMLTEMMEFGCKMKVEMKTIQSEMKENIQGTNTDGEGNRNSNQWFGPEGRNKHSTRTE